MSKKIKMVVFGEPGTGKSVFACGAPNPFFICTDGNYEWLEEFGAKEENHKQVFSWTEAKKVFASDMSKYDTIVVDLVEDLFKWCEYEFCQKNSIQHVGELPFGRGYDVSRNEFFIEISKLLNLDKNIILIMHGLTITCKDRRGVEYSKYVPTNRIPDKVIDMIEGRVRYFLRAFAVTEENKDGHLETKRYLSLSPDGTSEFGIARGLTGEAIPRYIPLDWNTFVTVATNNKQSEAPKVEEKVVEKSILEEVVSNIKVIEPVEEVKIETKPVTEPVTKPVVEPVKPAEPAKTEPVKAASASAPTPEVVDTNDKVAALKAKLAAMKANKNN